jgi:heterodisulfide reductase subunit C
MKQRGHRAYAHVDMEKVKHNAQSLPTKNIPPEIIRYLPLDDLQDKIKMQKMCYACTNCTQC